MTYMPESYTAWHASSQRPPQGPEANVVPHPAAHYHATPSAVPAMPMVPLATYHQVLRDLQETKQLNQHLVTLHHQLKAQLEDLLQHQADQWPGSETSPPPQAAPGPVPPRSDYQPPQPPTPGFDFLENLRRQEQVKQEQARQQAATARATTPARPPTPTRPEAVPRSRSPQPPAYGTSSEVDELMHQMHVGTSPIGTAPGRSYGPPPQQPDPAAYENYEGYDSLYQKARDQHTGSNVPMVVWLAAATLLLVSSFGAGFMLIQSRSNQDNRQPQSSLPQTISVEAPLA